MSEELVFVHEPALRLGLFLAVIGAMMVWERFAPRRPLGYARIRRWPNNLGISLVDTLVLRLVLPTTAVGVAVVAEQRGWGLLPALHWPGWLAVAAAVVLLDLAIYGQHILMHKISWLWWLHRVHHADLDFDTTTGIRFHPLEMVLSMLIKWAVIVALGAPALAVLIFELLLNATSLFNHGNVWIPGALERRLRWLVVTPDMHRVHHSAVPRETDSNFGFNLSCWDRLFGTYKAQPAAGHRGMTIGLDYFRDPAELRLDRLLLQPFRQAR
ncbi:MAG: sterol desaturase family protein [Candidatus Competibacterales bacterium]|nr:sterol desaturase family protein [Candidatus Competibacterales bacterium]